MMIIRLEYMGSTGFPSTQTQGQLIIRSNVSASLSYLLALELLSVLPLRSKLNAVFFFIWGFTTAVITLSAAGVGLLGQLWFTILAGQVCYHSGCSA
jgi:hypothetical protein